MFAFPPEVLSEIRKGPLHLQRVLWPDVCFYDKQREMVMSVRESKETYVVSANMMGKDFVGGYIGLSFFLWPQLYFDNGYVAGIDRQGKATGNNWVGPHTRRILTTSNSDDHLDVLWGEIGRWVMTCRFPLLAKDGGPLIVNHHEIRFAFETDASNPINYLKGQVAAKESKFSGHHAAYTAILGDESSDLEDKVKEQSDGWSKRQLWWGNPNDCANFWRRGIEAGDLLVEETRVAG